MLGLKLKSVSKRGTRWQHNFVDVLPKLKMWIPSSNRHDDVLETYFAFLALCDRIRQSLMDSPCRGPVMWYADIIFVVILTTLLTNSRWLETTWRSYDVTLMHHGKLSVNLCKYALERQGVIGRGPEGSTMHPPPHPYKTMFFWTLRVSTIRNEMLTVKI